MQLTPHLTANTFPPTPAQSFEALYQQSTTSLGKRPLQLDLQDDFPQAKRHASSNFDFPDFQLFPSSASATGSSWPVTTHATSVSHVTAEVGLPDEAADVCATWFNKYNVLPR
jgi:hypothetical protein